MKRLLLTLMVLVSAIPSHAVIVFGESGRNLSPPPDTARRACWELEGQWGKFLGTPVGSHWFLTADHVGGYVGDAFFFAGERYTAVAVEHLPGTDLALWRVSGSFPRWASLSTRNQVGQELFIVGRGTARGKELDQRGWHWGEEDYQMSWGTNWVSHLHQSDVVGELLAWTFDRGGDPNEGTLSSGDSGGGVFVKGEDGLWRLAGVNHDINPGTDGIDHFYSLTGKKEDLFRAAIYDGRGLLLGAPGKLVALSGTKPIPEVSVAAPVAPHLAWIRKILARSNDDYPSYPPLLETKIWRRGGNIIISFTVALVITLSLLLRRRGGKRY